MLGMTLLSLVWPLKKRNEHGAFDQMTRQYSQATVQRNPPAQDKGGPEWGGLCSSSAETRTPCLERVLGLGCLARLLTERALLLSKTETQFPRRTYLR